MSSRKALTRGILLVFALGAAACRKEAAPAATSPAPNDVTISAVDFAYNSLDTITAGLTRLRLINHGPSLHHIQLIHIEGGRTIDSLRAALTKPGPPPAWMKNVAGPNAVGTEDTSVAIMNIAAGHYAIVCFIPDSTGVPHFARGMIRALEVRPATGPAVPEPTADADVHLTDYAFSESAPLHAGLRTLKVINDGQQPHELFIARLDTGVTAQQLVHWVDSGMHGRPPARAVGGVSGIEKGDHAWVVANFAPGNYAFLCFVPDAKDGKEHVQHGMIQQLTVN